HVYALKTMDHSVGAITPLQAAEIGGDEFEQLLQDHPRIAQALYWDELVKIAIQREWTVNLGQRSAYERIAHLLCESYLRLRAVGLAQEHGCPFPLTQVDLADATGLTAVHVNRTLQELRKDGVIELYGRKLHIPSLQRLKSAALFNDNYLHLDHEGRHLDADD
ncbi:MAG: Crp/Fnr family transcriptional regulator, partial [Sphingomonadales bacterium]